MSGTSAKPAKVTGLSAESAAVPSGGPIRLRWSGVPAGADEVQLEHSEDGGKTWGSWGRSPDLAAFSKFGAADGGYSLRIIARKSGSDIAGSASDPVAVRVGPAPAALKPAPPPAPTPAPSTPAPQPTQPAPTNGTASPSLPPAELRSPTAADFAALRDRVAALEKAALAPTRGTGTMAVTIEGQAGQGTARVDMVLTPQTGAAT